MMLAGLVLSLVLGTLSGADGFITPVGHSVWGNVARSKLVGCRAVFPPPSAGHSKLSCSLGAGESGAGGDSVIISPVGDIFELERRVRVLEEELGHARRELQEAVGSGGAQGETTTRPPARSASEEARLRSQSPNPADPVNTLYNIQDLIRVVDALTADEGCPWTKTQVGSQPRPSPRQQRLEKTRGRLLAAVIATVQNGSISVWAHLHH